MEFFFDLQGQEFPVTVETSRETFLDCFRQVRDCLQLFLRDFNETDLIQDSISDGETVFIKRIVVPEDPEETENF